MPHTCPAGHQSETADYCDTCGVTIDPTAAASPESDTPPAAAATSTVPPASAPAPAEPAAAPTTVAPAATDVSAGWSAVVEADRSFFDRNEAVQATESVPFPSDLPARHVPLTGADALIGRRDDEAGIVPDIDAGVPVADPGVSRRHALLRLQQHDLWAVIDQGSTNGTWVNDADTPIRAGRPAFLRDGDHLHVGAWTRITLRRTGGASGAT